MVSEPFQNSIIYSVFLSFGYFSAAAGYTAAASGFTATAAAAAVEFWSSSLLLVIFMG